MTKYSNKLADKLAEMYESGEYGIQEICDTVGIHKDTFYEWRKSKPYFSDAIEREHEKRLQNLAHMALSGIALLLTKHEYEEVTTEYVQGKDNKPMIKSVKKTKKFIMPNPSMLTYVANNRLPQEWKTRNVTDHTNNGDSFNFGSFLMAENTIADGEEPTADQPETTDNNNE